MLDEFLVIYLLYCVYIYSYQINKMSEFVEPLHTPGVLTSIFQAFVNTYPPVVEGFEQTLPLKF